MREMESEARESHLEEKELNLFDPSAPLLPEDPPTKEQKSHKDDQQPGVDTSNFEFVNQETNQLGRKIRLKNREGVYLNQQVCSKLTKPFTSEGPLHNILVYQQGDLSLYAVTESEITKLHTHHISEEILNQVFLPKNASKIAEVLEASTFDHNSRTLFIKSLCHKKETLLLALKIFEICGSSEERGFKVEENLVDLSSQRKAIKLRLKEPQQEPINKKFELIIDTPAGVGNKDLQEKRLFSFYLSRSRALVYNFSQNLKKSKKAHFRNSLITAPEIKKCRFKTLMDLTYLIEGQYRLENKTRRLKSGWSNFVYFSEFYKTTGTKAFQFNSKYTLIVITHPKFIGLTLIDLKTKRLIKTSCVSIHSIESSQSIQREIRVGATLLRISDLISCTFEEGAGGGANRLKIEMVFDYELLTGEGRSNAVLQIPNLFLSELAVENFEVVILEDKRQGLGRNYLQPYDSQRSIKAYFDSASTRLSENEGEKDFSFNWVDNKNKAQRGLDGFEESYLASKQGKGLWLKPNFVKLTETRFLYFDSSLAFIFDHEERRRVDRRFWNLELEWRKIKLMKMIKNFIFLVDSEKFIIVEISESEKSFKFSSRISLSELDPGSKAKDLMESDSTLNIFMYEPPSGSTSKTVFLKVSATKLGETDQKQKTQILLKLDFDENLTNLLNSALIQERDLLPYNDGRELYMEQVGGLITLLSESPEDSCFRIKVVDPVTMVVKDVARLPSGVEISTLKLKSIKKSSQILQYKATKAKEMYLSVLKIYQESGKIHQIKVLRLGRVVSGNLIDPTTHQQYYFIALYRKDKLFSYHLLDILKFDENLDVVKRVKINRWCNSLSLVSFSKVKFTVIVGSDEKSICLCPPSGFSRKSRILDFQKASSGEIIDFEQRRVISSRVYFNNISTRSQRGFSQVEMISESLFLNHFD